MEEQKAERGPTAEALAEPGEPGSASSKAKPFVERRRRPHHTQAQRLEVLRLLAETELGREEFCASHGISSCTLFKWRQRFAEGGPAALEDKPNRRNSKGKSRGWYSPEERRAALEEFGRSGLGQREFARVWGIALKTLSDWLHRERAGGPKALEPRKPGRPRGSKNKAALPAPVRERIVTTKERFPTFGFRKVRDFLARFHGMKVSTGGVRNVLRDEGIPPLVVEKKRRRSSERPRTFERSRPGELWQSDITSFVLARHSQRVYLVVFLDDFSRYVVSFGLHTQMRSATVCETLLEGVARYGKPIEVLTDQGPQYFTWRGKSAFQKLLIREGIRHVVARSHHPQTVGKCERLWETVGREFWERVQPQDLTDARTRLSHFFAHYNHFRPHQGIEGLLPADRFFGANEAMKQAIEERISKNALQLALGEAPRTNAYVFMQVGEQQASVHGEKGVVVLTLPDGTRREIRSEELGIGKERAKEDDRGSSRRNGDEAGRSDQGSKDTDLQEARALQATAEASARGERALELGERGGEAARAPALRDDARAVARELEEGRGDGATWGPGASPVADVSVGALGYAGRASETASDEGRTECGDGPATRFQEGRETGPGAGEGERDSAESRESPEGSSGQPGREDRP